VAALQGATEPRPHQDQVTALLREEVVAVVAATGAVEAVTAEAAGHRIQEAARAEEAAEAQGQEDLIQEEEDNRINFYIY
jgi:uncharacterized protein (DUF362 family)